MTGNGQRKVLLIGLGFFERELLRTIAGDRAVIVIESSEDRIDHYRDEFEGIEFIQGDASSIVTWKKVPVDDVGHVITTIRDVDVNLEICHITRDTFKLEVPIIVLAYGDLDESLFEPFGATIVNPIQLGINVIIGILEKNYSRAINIGQRKGEIVEVTILSHSHVVDRKLKFIRPAKWAVAAIYREGKMMIPSGETRLKIMDRVVLVGDEKVLENLVNIMLKGVPQFPLQYGPTIVTALDRTQTDHLPEVVMYMQKTRAKNLELLPVKKKLDSELVRWAKEEAGTFEIGDPIDSRHHVLAHREAGLIIIPAKERFTIFNLWMRFAFANATKPFLLSRSCRDYKRLVISLNSPTPSQVLEVGLELARLFEIPFRVIYVARPRQMRSKAEDDAMKERQKVINDFEAIHQDKIDYQVFEGNPVKETSRFLHAADACLLVMSYTKGKPIGFFSPHVQYLIAGRSPMSVLLIPTEEDA